MFTNKLYEVLSASESPDGARQVEGEGGGRH